MAIHRYDAAAQCVAVFAVLRVVVLWLLCAPMCLLGVPAAACTALVSSPISFTFLPPPPLFLHLPVCVGILVKEKGKRGGRLVQWCCVGLLHFVCSSLCFLSACHVLRVCCADLSACLYAIVRCCSLCAGLWCLCAGLCVHGLRRVGYSRQTSAMQHGPAPPPFFLPAFLHYPPHAASDAAQHSHFPPPPRRRCLPCTTPRTQHTHPTNTRNAKR